jgi:hypothetical protein
VPKIALLCSTAQGSPRTWRSPPVLQLDSSTTETRKRLRSAVRLLTGCHRLRPLHREPVSQREIAAGTCKSWQDRTSIAGDARVLGRSGHWNDHCELAEKNNVKGD